MGAAGRSPWRCGSTAAVAPDTGSALTGTEGDQCLRGRQGGSRVVGISLSWNGRRPFGPAWTSMICDAVVLA